MLFIVGVIVSKEHWKVIIVKMGGMLLGERGPFAYFGFILRKCFDLWLDEYLRADLFY